MLKSLSFSFENDFQRLVVELDVSSGAIKYRIPKSENLDFVQKCDLWKTYEGDARSWMASIEALDIGSWNESAGSVSKSDSESCSESCSETSKTCRVFPESKVKWSLSLKRSMQQPEDVCETIEAFGSGSDSYPVNFTDLLELLKELLGLPVLLLEL